MYSIKSINQVRSSKSALFCSPLASTPTCLHFKWQPCIVRSNKFALGCSAMMHKVFVLENGAHFSVDFSSNWKLEVLILFSFPWHFAILFSLSPISLSVFLSPLLRPQSISSKCIEWIVKLCIISVQFLFSVFPLSGIGLPIDLMLEFVSIQIGNSRARVKHNAFPVHCVLCVWHANWWEHQCQQ